MTAKEPEKDKLDKIRELFRGLSEEEKNRFMTEIADDEELMAVLLAILTERNVIQEETESEGGTDSYIDFLRRVKE